MGTSSRQKVFTSLARELPPNENYPPCFLKNIILSLFIFFIFPIFNLKFIKKYTLKIYFNTNRNDKILNRKGKITK
jgi:hypothetical protein